MDTAMDYENVQGIGSLLGSASVIVIDDSHSMDWVINKTIHFFAHESCGKCTPCRDGTYWMKHLMDDLGHDGVDESKVVLLKHVALQMQGKCLCALGEFATMAVVSAIERFPEDFRREVTKPEIQNVMASAE
jgi:NADH-quinone oxidoreductase subunit F